MTQKITDQAIRALVQYPELSPELSRGQTSIFIRHLDCGSCNGCELELNALMNPIYDIAQYGIQFKASPRHADLLALTGCFTRKLEQAARLTLEAMPTPRVMTIGDCAGDGGLFKGSYAVQARPEMLERAIRETDLHVPGCPPTPEDILKAILQYSAT